MASILTIVTAATVRALTTRAAVKAELGLTATNDDAWIDAEILAASSAIESYCGRIFARETVTQTWRDICREHVLCARTPVATLVGLVEDGVTLAAADYELDAQTGLIYRLSGDSRTTWRARKLAATYTAGFLLPGQAGANLPADIERACRLAVVSSYQQRGRDVMIRSESVDGVASTSYLDPRAGDGGLPRAVADSLGSWRSFAV